MIYLIAALVGIIFGLIAVEYHWPAWAGPFLAFVTMILLTVTGVLA